MKPPTRLPGLAGLVLKRLWYDRGLTLLALLGVILAVGLVASMMLLVSTTEIELEFKGVKIKKGKATAEQIKAIAEPLFKAIGKIANI